MNGSYLILAKLAPLDHIAAHKLFSIKLGPYQVDVDNHMLMVLVAAVLLVVILTQSVKHRSLVPRGLRNLIESICVFIRDDIAKPNLGEHADRFVGYLWTTFFFILFCNLLAMVPTAAFLYIISGGYLKHLGGAATTNIWITGTLAVISFAMIHIAGVVQHGLWGYMKVFVPNVPFPLIPIMFVLELAGAFVKPFALAIRLFANILAGHAVLATLIGLILFSRSYFVGGITVVACAAFSLLELFVAFLQAYIFTFLTAMFIGASVNPQH